MTSCGTNPSEQSLVIETCKEIKLPGPCPALTLCPDVVVAASVSAGSLTLSIECPTCPAAATLLPAIGAIVGICGAGIAPGTVATVTAGLPCTLSPLTDITLSLSLATTAAITAGELVTLSSTPVPLTFNDLTLLFDSSQCGAPRFSLIEVTNLGNCEVALFSVTSFAVVPTSTVATLELGGSGCTPTVALASGVSGINLILVQPGQSTVITSCDLVSLFSFCFSTVTASSASPSFTANGCDFTFSIKAFFCVPGCGGNNKQSSSKNASALMLV